MVLFKIALVGAAVVALMVAAQKEHWPQKIGVASSCEATYPPPGQPAGTWYACKEGILNGFPNLEGDSCIRIGEVQGREVWRCDGPLSSVPGM